MAIAFASLNVQAQREHGEGHGHGHGKYKKEAIENLNLTADQKREMRQIKIDYKNQAEAIRNNSSLSEEERHAQLKKLHQVRKERMKSLLTAEQRARLEQSPKYNDRDDVSDDDGKGKKWKGKGKGKSKSKSDDDRK